MRLELDGVTWFFDATVTPSKGLVLSDIVGIDLDGNGARLTPDVQFDLTAYAYRNLDKADRLILDGFVDTERKKT